MRAIAKFIAEHDRQGLEKMLAYDNIEVKKYFIDDLFRQYTT